MKLISVILTLLFLPETNVKPSYLIIQGKSITINGNTSIGGFSCDYDVTGKNDTLFIKNLASQPYGFTIPVSAFQCGNFILNKDFQNTLQSKRYPKASVQVLNLKETGKGVLNGKLKLTLVGKSKIIDNVCFTWNETDQTILLAADFVFLASDFDLTPPKKLGGMIKTDNAMNIIVELVLKPVYEPWYSEAK
jgi:hypothetical protein